MRIVKPLSAIDPVQASDLSSEVLSLLREYNGILASNLAVIPAHIQPTVELWESALPSPAAVANDDGARQEDDHGIDVAGSFPTMTAMPIILPASTPTGLPAVSIVLTDDGTCQGLLGAITVGNLRVPQDASCIPDGTRVRGNIKIENGASLTALRVTVIGSIHAEGASFVDVLAGSTVGGSIQIKQGGSARAEYVLVNGDIQFESNHGALSIVGNQVRKIQVFQNAGGVTVSANTVNGNLQCRGNNPAPVGGNNIVQGSREDQCAGL
jgi:hypothetical protein